MQPAIRLLVGDEPADAALPSRIAATIALMSVGTLLGGDGERVDPRSEAEASRIRSENSGVGVGGEAAGFGAAAGRRACRGGSR